MRCRWRFGFGRCGRGFHPARAAGPGHRVSGFRRATGRTVGARRRRGTDDERDRAAGPVEDGDQRQRARVNRQRARDDGEEPRQPGGQNDAERHTALPCGGAAIGG